MVMLGTIKQHSSMMKFKHNGRNSLNKYLIVVMVLSRQQMASGKHWSQSSVTEWISKVLIGTQTIPNREMKAGLQF